MTTCLGLQGVKLLSIKNADIDGQRSECLFPTLSAVSALIAMHISASTYSFVTLTGVVVTLIYCGSLHMVDL